MQLHFEHHLKGEPAVPTDLGSCHEILNLSISRSVPDAQLDDGRWCEQEHEAGQTTQQEVRPAGLFTNARILPWRGELRQA